LLHSGYFLADDMGMDGGLRADNPLRNHWMLAGLEQAGFDAINVSYHDLPGLEHLDALPESLVSANVQATDNSPEPARFLIFEQDGIRVGVTGITQAGMTFVSSPRYTIDDPVTKGIEALRDLAPKTDVLVLLVYEAREAIEQIISAVPELDVVIDSRMHREFSPPLQLGSTVLTHAHYQTQRLGELRLDVDDGEITLLQDRKIDLDPEVPDEPKLMEMLHTARTEIDEVQETLFGDP